MSKTKNSYENLQCIVSDFLKWYDIEWKKYFNRWDMAKDIVESAIEYIDDEESEELKEGKYEQMFILLYEIYNGKEYIRNATKVELKDLEKCPSLYTDTEKYIYKYGNIDFSLLVDKETEMCTLTVYIPEIIIDNKGEDPHLLKHTRDAIDYYHYEKISYAIDGLNKIIDEYEKNGNLF